MADYNHNKELKALIQLLDEPDEKVFAAIREKIMSYGIEAIPLLEEGSFSVNQMNTRIRVESLISQIRSRDTFVKLKEWADHRSFDLLDAYCLISGLYQEDESATANRKSVEKLYRDVWLEMNDELTALEKIRLVNHVFFDVYGFSGYQSDHASLPAYLLGSLLRMQSGNPLSMSALYLIVSQKLGLPIFGVNLPHHFILAYMDDTRLIKPAGDYTQEEVLFYINPFNKGAIFRKSEIELFVKQLNIKERESFYLPCDNVTVIRRLLNEILVLHQENHKKDQATAIRILLKAVAER